MGVHYTALRLHSVLYALLACLTGWLVQVLVPLIAYVGAPASGAHFNPIVTFAFMVSGIQVTQPRQVLADAATCCARTTAQAQWQPLKFSDIICVLPLVLSPDLLPACGLLSCDLCSST